MKLAADDERVKADLRPKFNRRKRKKRKRRRPSEYAAVAALYMAGKTADKPPSVSKHASHNQKTHGNWARGVGASELLSFEALEEWMEVEGVVPSMEFSVRSTGTIEEFRAEIVEKFAGRGWAGFAQCRQVRASAYKILGFESNRTVDPYAESMTNPGWGFGDKMKGDPDIIAANMLKHLHDRTERKSSGKLYRGVELEADQLEKFKRDIKPGAEFDIPLASFTSDEVWASDFGTDVLFELSGGKVFLAPQQGFDETPEYISGGRFRVVEVVEEPISQYIKAVHGLNLLETVNRLVVRIEQVGTFDPETGKVSKAKKKQWKYDYLFDFPLSRAISRRRVSKHARHNQKSHGNWARGLTGAKALAALASPDLPNRKDQLALINYTEADGFEVNQLLRDNDFSTGYIRQKYTALRRSIDKAFDTLPSTPENMTLYRKIIDDRKVFGPPGSSVGDIFTDAGYFSTSVSRAAANKHSPDHGVTMEVRVPKGSKALPIFKYSKYEKEKEVLLPRGSEFEVVTDELTGKGRKIVLMLRPPEVSKHARHNQKSHGNWARGGSVLGNVLDRFRDFTSYEAFSDVISGKVKGARIQVDIMEPADGVNHSIKVTAPHPTIPFDPRFSKHPPEIPVANINWSSKTGTVEGIRVEEDFKRRGIASALYELAEEVASEKGLKPPKHSITRTGEGKVWSREFERRRAHKKLAVYVPKDGERPEGVRVRGTPIDWDDDRIPDTLYHATTNREEVLDSGRLKAGGAGGLGGDPNDRIVSLTTNRRTALQIGKDLKLAARAARVFRDNDTLVEALTALSKKDGWDYSKTHLIRTLREGYKHPEGYGHSEPRGLDARSAKDLLTDYFMVRQSKTGKPNPLIFSSLEELQKVNPSNIGIVTVPKKSLKNNKSLITDFDLGQKGGLDEIRVYGDVAFKGNVVVKINKHGDPDITPPAIYRLMHPNSRRTMLLRSLNEIFRADSEYDSVLVDGDGYELNFVEARNKYLEGKEVYKYRQSSEKVDVGQRTKSYPTSEELAALHMYTDTNAYRRIRERITEGPRSSLGQVFSAFSSNQGQEYRLDIDEIIEHLDSLIAKGELYEGVVRRGINDKSGRFHTDLQPGDIIEDPSFVSTTAATTRTARRLLSKFIGANPVIVEIYIPEGSRGIHVTDMRTASIGDGKTAFFSSTFQHEEEVLLPRGSQFKFISEYSEELRWVGRVPRILRFELIPQTGEPPPLKGFEDSDLVSRRLAHDRELAMSKSRKDYGRFAWEPGDIKVIRNRRARLKKHGDPDITPAPVYRIMHPTGALGMPRWLRGMQFDVRSGGGGPSTDAPTSPTGGATNWVKTAGGINNARAKKMKFVDAQGNPITVTEARALIKRPGKTVFAYGGETAKPKVRAGSKPRSVIVPKKTVFKGFHPATDEERKKLGIPPAWTDVHVADDPDARRIAVGRDAAGQLQSRYSATHTEDQAAKKFTRTKELINHLPSIDARIEKDVDESDEAAVLMLIRQLGMRPGTVREGRGAKKAYGATTLESRYIKFNESGSATFAFVGKKGVDIRLTTRDQDIINMLESRVSNNPSDRLFDTNESRVRTYFYGIVGDKFNLKDLRTVKANVIALDLVSKMAKPKTKKDFQKKRKEVGTKVSKALGNTPDVALKSYINPTVFAEWEANIG